MRAIQYDRTGDADVLTLVGKPDPAPGPGELAVRIHSSGVNPTDVKSRRGVAGKQDHVDPAQTPGQDGAGVVEAAGSEADQEWVGRRVWIWEAAWRRPDGTAQEVAIVPVTHVAQLPDDVPFSVGASLGIPFLTAHRCLTVGEHMPKQLGPSMLDGKIVLIAGGAGAVGNAAIQLAKWSGATVVTTVSSEEKTQLAKSAGADHVIDYRSQDVVAEVLQVTPDGVDAIVEVAPGPNAPIDAAVIAQGGVIATYASEGGAGMTIPVRAFMSKNAGWAFVMVYTAPKAAKLQAVRDVELALVSGAIRVGEAHGLPLHHFPLERAADAHRAFEGSAVGKVVIDVVP